MENQSSTFLDFSLTPKKIVLEPLWEINAKWLFHTNYSVFLEWFKYHFFGCIEKMFELTHSKKEKGKLIFFKSN
jgi:hypothetical protein